MSVSSLLKEGTQHLSGLEESILKNIEACKSLSAITRTSLGPNGMNKMLITQNDKLYVSKDAATIVKELEVVHPAAKMVVMASEMQDTEAGDGTNFVISLAGALLEEAESLIRHGVHPSDILQGYAKAGKKAQEILEAQCVGKLEDVCNIEKVTELLLPVVMAKQMDYSEKLGKVIAEACVSILPRNPKNFNVDNVRVTKVVGSGVSDAILIKGFAMPRDAEGTIKHVKQAKVAVLAAGLDIAKTENKGTVLLESADDLMNYAKSEEAAMEKIAKELSNVGVNVLVSGGNVGELALHFLERAKIMVVKVPSKFQLRRICRACKATPLVRVGAPTAEELGACTSVSVDEVAGTKVCIFKNDDVDTCGISTIFLRGSTDNILDDLERCIDDAVNTFKGYIKDGRYVAGAGAVEVELARELRNFGASMKGLDQFAVKKFATALEVIPRTLAENCGLKGTETLASLYAAHEAGDVHHGVNVVTSAIQSSVEHKIFDSYHTKAWAIKLATDAVLTILRVDQIIMAKAAGGPKPRSGQADPDDGFA